MPSEKFESTDGGFSERDKERGSERDRDKNGSKAKGAQSKVKDLSHVPCKFFKLGQCTAGSSCPFSHQLSEPGQQKDVCQWFVKGNCKFGHKCALAHLLPGQPMSMDRKNKKAAQQAAAAAGGGGSGGGGGRGDRRKPPSGSAVREDSLRVGLGRGMGRGTAPISISKATISPSAPAPPLRDTDFPFGLPDDFTKPVQSQNKLSDASDDADAAIATTSRDDSDIHSPLANDPPAQNTAASPPQQDSSRPSPLPLSSPSGHRGFNRQNGSGDFGFGPIGSPPRSSPGHTPTSQGISQGQRINGFSPSISPSRTGIGAPISSTSPFSAPAAKSIFMSYSLDRDSSASTQLKASTTSTVVGGGVAASLGAGRGWDIGYTGAALGGVVDEDDDLEEFLPSSLNELLTDEEKKRRWSRTGGQRPSIEQQHRYSRSVPAASLMDNVKNIWNENGQEHHGSGTPSPSLLGTSNISTGFMPQRPSMGTTRAFSDSPAAARPGNTHLGYNGLGSPPGGGFASPPISSFYNLGRPPSHPHPMTSTSSNFNAQQPRPIPGATGEEAFNGNPLSPSARALQEHAPGQSLPQGLAAGLSRIHIKPPAALGTSTSPHHIQGFQGGSPSPGIGVSMGRGFSTSGEFSGTGFGGLGQGSPSGLNRDPFDRLPSFGSRGTGIGSGSGPNSGGPSPTPGSMGVSFRRQQQWASHPLSSPLSGPVITNDEDDGLFDMDEDAK